MRPLTNQTKWRSASTLLLSTSLASAVGLAQGAVAVTTGAVVTTYDYNSARTGHDIVTGTITGLSTTPAWNKHLDGAVYGEPLLFGGRVLVATENDSLYALDPHNGAVVWHLHVGTAVSTSVIDQATGLSPGCGAINPLGITGTPVIDPVANVIYVAEETMVGATDWHHIRHELVAVSLSSARVLWTRMIDPPHGNTVGGYTIAALQQRPALTLANGRVYVNFGGLAGDCGTYHGFVIGVATNGAGPELVYQVPTQTEGAIWATNGALVSPTGNLYVDTGNGSSTTNYDGSNAVIELSATLHLISQWAPTNWATLSAQDWDLGSAGPIFIPGTSLMFVAGKPANGSFGYLIDSHSLGHGPASALFTGNVCSDPTQGVFGADASVVLNVAGHQKTFIYAACLSGTEALQVTGGPTPSFSQAWGPISTSSGGPPIVAGGLVWSLDFNNYQLVALAPATGYVIFKRSTASLPHFATPTLGDGLVVIPTLKGVEAFATRP